MTNGDAISVATDTEGYEEEETYQWMAFSECAVCNALVGLYDVPPPRPHPYCECQVIRLGRGTPDLVQCQSYWDFEQVRNEYSGPDPLHPHIEMFFDVFVYCWDGGIYEYQEYEIDYDPSTFGTATLEELRQVAEDMARYNCRDSHDCLGVS